jgi:hypothetical protein
VSSLYNEVLKRKASRQVRLSRIVAQINRDIEREDWGSLAFRAHVLASIAKSLELDDILLADRMDDGDIQ